jgi:hypothetical protein
MDLFAQCMRSHGEPDFYFVHPDIAANPSATVLSFMGYQVVGIDPQTAQFASAACMRAHGFPDYPDPSATQTAASKCSRCPPASTRAPRSTRRR